MWHVSLASVRDILPRERSARPFPSRQHRMQTGGGEATRRYSAPRSLTFPAPSEWKTPSEQRGPYTSFITDWSRPVAGTDWALWKKYNPLWALRGNRNYRASDRVKRERESSRWTEWSSSLFSKKRSLQVFIGATHSHTTCPFPGAVFRAGSYFVSATEMRSGEPVKVWSREEGNALLACC